MWIRPNFRIAILLAVSALLMSDIALQESLGWGKGHKLIRRWAVSRLPAWQHALLSDEEWKRFVNDYSSLQDQHAGGKASSSSRH